MIYGILADIVVLTHLLWIVFLMTGAYWGRNHRIIMIVHGAGLAYAIALQVFGWYCPLTHLEVWLREKQFGSGAYFSSFIAHYAEKLVYIDVTPEIVFIMTLVLISVNVWIYSEVVKKKKI